MAVTLYLALIGGALAAAPYAAMVMDARTGEVLHSRNADTKLHPASLTKMMTLYVAFQAVEKGEISLDTRVRISRHAASQPPSKLGLRAGSRIQLRYLIRAAAVKSANDAATAIAEAISGTEAKFAQRMTRTARAMGMKRTTFKNAHGLTQTGHVSTARDMTILGRHVLYDYPQYYNLFSRRTTDAGLRSVRNTNRRLLESYRGADGIKTGYTRAAGFNLVASAERGSERVIATVFGGSSGAARNARVAELLNMGFRRAPTRATLRRPKPPRYTAPGTRTAQTQTGRITRQVTAVQRSLRPQARPFAPAISAETLAAVAAATPDVTQALQIATAAPAIARIKPQARPADLIPVAEPAPAAAPEPAETTPQEQAVAAATTAPTPAAPTRLTITPTVSAAPKPGSISIAPSNSVVTASATTQDQVAIVPRISTSGGKHWGITVGKYPSQGQAERVLMRMQLAESMTLNRAEWNVRRSNSGFEARFTGLDRDMADLACRRLQAQQYPCIMVGPGS